VAQRAISEAADRYAAAAFDLASESGALDAIDNDLKVFAAAIADNPDLKTAASSPLIAPEEKARALTAVAEKLGLSELGRKLIGVVAINGRASELTDVAAAFARRLAAHRGTREVEIISAAPMDAAQLDSLTRELSKALGVTVQPTTRVDESLIGGFIVNAGSRQFDASIRTKLDSLKLALKA
jgi:F-type H+-transporting ATPase subunit delta